MLSITTVSRLQIKNLKTHIKSFISLQIYGMMIKNDYLKIFLCAQIKRKITLLKRTTGDLKSPACSLKKSDIYSVYSRYENKLFCPLRTYRGTIAKKTLYFAVAPPTRCVS